MEEQIRKLLEEKVNPVLEAHYGGAILTGFENGVARVKFTGACAGCPSAQSTLEDVVKGILMENSTEVKDVELDTSVSEDLLDMARKILNKSI